MTYTRVALRIHERNSGLELSNIDVDHDRVVAHADRSSHQVESARRIPSVPQVHLCELELIEYPLRTLGASITLLPRTTWSVHFHLGIVGTGQGGVVMQQ